jgi:hypothetical protein
LNLGMSRLVGSGCALVRSQSCIFFIRATVGPKEVHALDVGVLETLVFNRCKPGASFLGLVFGA